MEIKFSSMTTLLQVYDIQKSIEFYGNLGFNVLNQSEGEITWVLLGLNGLRLMLNTIYEEGERPSSRDPDRQLIHSDTGLFINCENVDKVYEYLVGKDTTIDPPFTRDYGMRQLYLKDADGYVICFQQTV